MIAPLFISPFNNRAKFGEGSFSPISLSPKLWLDFTDLSTLDLTGTDITQVDDKSGNGYHFSQGTPANKPVIDSATTPTKVIFTAANSEFLDGTTHVNNFNTDSQGEIVILAHNTNQQSSYFSLGQSASSIIYVDLFIRGTQPELTFRNGAYDPAIFSNVSINEVEVNNWVSDGSNYSFYNDNVSQSLISGTDDGDWYNDTSSLLDIMSIGANIRLTANYYNAQIGELFYFSSPLSTNNRTALYDYLAAKHTLG